MGSESNNSEENGPGKFAKQGGEALNLGGEFNDSDEEENEMMKPQKPEGSGGKPSGEKVAGKKLDNQPYDLAVDANDSEEIESDEEDDEVGDMNAGGQRQNPQQQQKQQN